MSMTRDMVWVPSLEDLHRLIKAFASVHVDGEKDFIGPNQPDAPFFTRLANATTISWLDADEMAERFHKYVNTQLPKIQHIAGYPPETNWESALGALKQKGETAKADKDVLRVYLNDAYNLGNHDWVTRDGKPSVAAWAVWIKDNTVFEMTEAITFVQRHIKKVEYQHTQANYQTTLQCERFTRVWYSKNDYNMRWPKEVPSVSIKLPVRDDVLYPTLKEQVGWPDFCYEGKPAYRMSIKDERGVIERAVAALKPHFITTALESMLTDAPIGAEDDGPKIEGFTANLIKDGVWIHIPFKEADIRYIAKSCGAKWQNDSKQWALPLRQVNAFVNQLDEGHDLIPLIKGIPEVGRYLETRAERVAISGAALLNDDERIQEMEARLTEVFTDGHALYPFQYVGVRFAELANGRCVLGDDMGIGKTMQAIAYAALHEELWPVLIVAPANVKYNWFNEVTAWLGDNINGGLQVIKNGGSPIADAGITIINYDLVNKKKDALLAFGYNLVIFDESHYLKSATAKRTQACMEIAEQADSVLCLSGTPIPNRPIEFFTTLEMIRPSEWKGKKYDYAYRYCDGHKNDYGYWDDKGASNSKELHEMCRDFMIRRLKKEVMEELPDKIRQHPPVIPNQAEMNAYVDARETWVHTHARLMNQNAVPKGFILNMLTDLRKKCGKLKVQAAIEWVRSYLEHGDKPIVVYTHHLDILKAITDALKDDFVCAAIHGAVGAEKRTAIVQEFQSNGIDVLVCSTIAAKEGLTLTAADTVVFVEREWVPAFEEQAEDRINRIGQDNDTVWAVYLTVEGTIDAKFNNIIESKRSVITAIVDGGEMGQRNSVVKQLLQAMVDAGEIPATMLETFQKETKGAKKYE